MNVKHLFQQICVCSAAFEYPGGPTPGPHACYQGVWSLRGAGGFGCWQGAGCKTLALARHVARCGNGFHLFFAQCAFGSLETATCHHSSPLLGAPFDKQQSRNFLDFTFATFNLTIYPFTQAAHVMIRLYIETHYIWPCTYQASITL